MPPVEDAVILPVDSPKHTGLVEPSIKHNNSAGSVNVTSTHVDVHPTASSIVIVYTPAAKPVNTPLPCGVPPFKLNVTAPVPPVEDAVILPVDSPKHTGLVEPSIKHNNSAGFVNVTSTHVDVHPTASSIVIVYTPAAKPVNTPLPCGVPPFKLNVTAPVPPVEDAVILPVDSPKHTGLVEPSIKHNNSAGFVNVTSTHVDVHPTASSIVIVYTPAAKPVNTPLPCGVPPFKLNVTAPVPPVEDAVILPVDSPKHTGLVEPSIKHNNSDGFC